MTTKWFILMIVSLMSIGLASAVTLQDDFDNTNPEPWNAINASIIIDRVTDFRIEASGSGKDDTHAWINISKNISTITSIQSNVTVNWSGIGNAADGALIYGFFYQRPVWTNPSTPGTQGFYIWADTDDYYVIKRNSTGSKQDTLGTVLDSERYYIQVSTNQSHIKFILDDSSDFSSPVGTVNTLKDDINLSQSTYVILTGYGIDSGYTNANTIHGDNWVIEANGTTITTASVDLLTPLAGGINTSLSMNFTYNVSLNTGFNLDNCSLLLNTTTLGINITDQNPTNNSNNSFKNVPLSARDWLWNVQCVDTNGGAYNATANRTLGIDTSNPTIQADFIRHNRTFTTDILTGQLNASDPHLFSIAFKLNNTVKFNATGITLTDYQFNYSYNVSNYTAGLYNASFLVCDGHTANQLKDDWDYDLGLAKVTFRDEKESWFRIEPEDGSIFDDFSVEQQSDKYSFTYEESEVTKTGTTKDISFIVEATDDISIVQRESEYNGWLVIPSMGEQGRWIDFNLLEAPNAIYNVERISKTMVRVTISNLPLDLQTYSFESTGDLNCVEEHYLWYKFNTSVAYTTPVTETSTQQYSINITRNSTFMQSANATLTWNNTNYSVQSLVSSDFFYFNTTIGLPNFTTNSNVNLNWSYTIIGNLTRHNTTPTQIQQVVDVNFDDCSVNTIQTLNFTMLLDSTNESVNGTMDFSFNLRTLGVELNYSTHKEKKNNTLFCISGSTVNFTTDAHVSYNASGLALHTYFIQDLIIDNTTRFIPLYVQQGTSLIVFTVRDENDDFVEGAIIEILKYDVGTNTFRLTESLQTDNNGQAVGNVILDTTWYKILVKYNGVLEIDDGALKLTSQTRSYRINIGDQYGETLSNILNVSHSLTFTNSTGNFLFTYSDPTGEVTQGCLEVVNQSSTVRTVMATTCSSQTAGSIVVSIGNPNMSVYTGTGYVIDSAGDRHVLEVLAVDFESDWRVFSENGDGLFLGFLIVVTLAMAGMFHPVAGIALTLFGVVVVNLLGLYHLNPPILLGVLALGVIALYRMGRQI